MYYFSLHDQEGFAMLKRHVDQVWTRLDELYANGTTFISWGEIYHWYEVERISKTPWRDVKAKPYGTVRKW